MLVALACACSMPEEPASEVPLPADGSLIPAAARAAIEAQAVLCRAHPREAAAVAQLGRIYHANEQKELAARCYERALALGSADVRTRHLLGLIELERGRTEQAILQFTRAIEREPSYAPLQHNLGRSLLDAGQVESAIPAIERAVALDPREPAYHVTLGRALRQAGRLERAVAELERALALDRDEPDAHQLLALTLRALGRDAEAGQHLGLPARRSGSVVPDPWLLEVQNLAATPEILIDRAESYLARGRIAAAVDLAQRAVAAEPDHAPAQRVLSRALLAAGRRDEALGAMVRAAEIEPHDAEAHAALAMMLFENGRSAEAQREADTALAADPAHPLAGIVKAALALAAGRTPQALSIITPVVLRGDHLPAAHVVHGDVLSQLGQYEQAAAAYRRAIELEPRGEYPYRRLGLTYLALGRRDEARLALLEAARIDPHVEETRRALARIGEAP